GNQERKNAGALDVSQELEAQPLPFVRAFDDSRNVGNDEGPMIRQLDHSQVRSERRKGIVGDLWARSGNHREQSGFAGIRLAHQAHVCDQLELELEFWHFALLTRLPLARCLMSSGRKECVAFPTATAFRDYCFLTVFQDFCHDLASVVVANDRPWRDRQNLISARMPCLVRTHAVLAALG